jgi:hypothetical protein
MRQIKTVFGRQLSVYRSRPVCISSDISVMYLLNFIFLQLSLNEIVGFCRILLCCENLHFRPLVWMLVTEAFLIGGILA